MNYNDFSVSTMDYKNNLDLADINEIIWKELNSNNSCAVCSGTVIYDTESITDASAETMEQQQASGSFGNLGVNDFCNTDAQHDMTSRQVQVGTENQTGLNTAAPQPHEADVGSSKKGQKRKAKKEKAYERKTPFEDKDAEQKRQNAIKSRKYRIKKKCQEQVLRQEVKRLQEKVMELQQENSRLQQKVIEQDQQLCQQVSQQNQDLMEENQWLNKMLQSLPMGMLG